MRTFFATLAFAIAAAPVAAQGHDHGGGHGAGQLPEGWHARFDNPEHTLADVMFMAHGGGFHARMGAPRAIFWNPEHSASGSYTVTAAFTQPRPPEHLDGYGLIIGGKDLEAPTQDYVYFLIRHDGRYIIKHRGGAEVHTIADWTEHPAVQKPDAQGRSSNTLSIDVGVEQVRFLVNGTEVASYDRAVMTQVEGIAGLRVNHGVDVFVDRFALDASPSGDRLPDSMIWQPGR
jgi:hypothetical protein